MAKLFPFNSESSVSTPKSSSKKVAHFFIFYRNVKEIVLMNEKSKFDNLYKLDKKYMLVKINVSNI